MADGVTYTPLKLLNNRELLIPTVDTKHTEYEGRVKSPEWMVKIDEVLSSNDADAELKKHCELFGWQAKSSRATAPDLSNNLFTSASLHHSNLVLIIPNGGYAASLEVLMNTGKLIEVIRIVRLGNVGTLKVVFQEILFNQCRISGFEQQLDRLVIEAHINIRQNKIFVYDNKGQSTGQMVSQVDYITNVAQAGS